MSQLFLRVGDIETKLRLCHANSFMSRLKGVGRDVDWRQFDVLYLPRCRAIHCWGLRRCIDVAFTASDGQVLVVRPLLRPWSTAWCREATSTWEFRAATLRAWGIKPGVRLSVVRESRCVDGALPVGAGVGRDRWPQV